MRISLLVLLALNFGCASLSRPLNTPKQVEIVFKGKPGEVSENRYYSNSRTQKSESGQLLNDKQEIVEFTVSSKVTGNDGKTISSVSKTTHKDGPVELHDLAFPELNEEIEFVIQPDGRILKAGKNPPTSIFFVPSIPVPGHPVQIGDTWTMEHTWYSGHEHIPLKLDVVGILKDIVPCEKAFCADIEVSGNVTLIALPNAPGTRFDSRVWGRMLFSLERGDVVWSEMRSREEMVLDNTRTFVESCMISRMMLKPEDKKLKFECDSKEQPVTKIPKL